MKRCKLICCMLALLMILVPMQALAAGTIDTDKEVTLSLSFQDGLTPVVGARFSLYKVAEVDAYGQLTITDDFAGYSVDIHGENDEAWRDLAVTLEGYAAIAELTPAATGATSNKPGEEGMLTFKPREGETLTAGLYLVVGESHSQDGYRYEVAPMIVHLPVEDKENNSWVYSLTAALKFSVYPEEEEPQTITRKVLKIWDDAGYEINRPESIDVHLLKDGVVYDTATLNDLNGWSYEWTELDSTAHWNVVEEVPAGYSVVVEQQGITFVVTNGYDPQMPPPPDVPPEDPEDPVSPGNPDNPVSPENPKNPVLPQTGQLWWPVPVILADGLLLVVVGMIRRKGEHDEA